MRSITRLVGRRVRARASSLLATFRTLWKRTKRTREPSEGDTVPKKRLVGYDTFKKWRTDLDGECQTVSWLECETVVTAKVKAGQKMVVKLKCKICSKFEAKLASRRTLVGDG